MIICIIIIYIYIYIYIYTCIYIYISIYIYICTYRWTCTPTDGSCRYDVPEPDTLDYCTKNQTNSIWDRDQQRFAHQRALIDCSKFNMAQDYQTKSGQLWITTYEEHLHEEKDSLGSWQQVPSVVGTRLTSGAEQIVVFHGTLPGELAKGTSVKGTTLGHLQGFLKYANEPDAKARRIPFAREGQWLNADAKLAVLKYDWTSQYPKEAVSGNDSKPEFFYNSTGCFQVADEGMGVYCHLPELLKAAGVNLDQQDSRHSSARVQGIVLKVQLKLTNMDVHDFWTWPIGRKAKYVIKVSSSRGSDADMYRSYHARHDSDTSSRLRTDHYGITLITSSESSWAEFSISALVSTLVIAAGVVKYAHAFANHVLVFTYANLGCIHISRLYKYNTFTKSAHEHEVKELNDSRAFLEVHQRTRSNDIARLFEVEPLLLEVEQQYRAGVIDLETGQDAIAKGRERRNASDRAGTLIAVSRARS